MVNKINLRIVAISVLAVLLLCGVVWARGVMTVVVGQGVSGGGGGASAPTYHNGSSGYVEISSGGALTYTHTINSSLSNGAAVVLVVTYAESSAVSSVTYDGTSMTQLGTIAYTPDSLFKGYLYGVALGNKSASTYNVVISVGNGTMVASACWVGNGAAQTGTFGTYASNQGSSTTSASVNVSSGSTQYPLAFASYYGTGTIANGSGQTSPFTSDYVELISTRTGESTSAFSFTLNPSGGYITQGVSIVGAE